jgi:cobalamin synthase
MSSRRWTIALCAWTGIVWTTRIGNIWNDDALTNGEKWGRTGLAMSFTLLALVVVVGLVTRSSWQRLAVRVLAAWTTAVWVVRAFGIATGDHEAAFIAVHVVLAIVSISLAAQAVRRET